MASLDAKVEIRTRAARLWLQLVAFPVGLLFGSNIGMRIGIWGTWRLVRWRIGNGRWRRFEREYHKAVAEDARKQ